MRAVRVSDGRELAQRFALHLGQRPVVGEDPTTSPEDTLEGMRVFERRRTDCPLAYVCATASSVWMGLSRTNGASGLSQAGAGSRNRRANDGQ
ncbi:MAG TPA: hypothetical protein VHJ19_03950 [Gammaproteobacteria bacterium]|nr:hypothetical protein [Gammaproteobacteria bacterium]